MPVIQINKKIQKADLLKDNKDHVVIQHIDETVQRPGSLKGTTYKLVTPLSNNSIYVTINDIILNEGTEYETVQPFEIFINSKEMKNFQWITALTRLVSAVFRKGGDITFIVEELSSIFDPNGGYIAKGGKFIPSIIAEIALIIEKHLKEIGIIKPDKMDEAMKKHLESKKREYEEKTGEVSSKNSYPKGSTLCQKCGTVAVINLDNCLTCLCCGDSKCGR